ncbi:MAG: hypothetical protein UV41_C0020G0009 [Candidatus Daviesbacteria bacterium GW2011_GWA2_42_7]|uniref:Uncharacterized protein n=2 Tax=Candidatus Daviesiibacteriota TaxID=1752718 RepID=A0A0G1D0M5_9BACT|nr:MAG: hypothetical protein UV33_C0026G0003 [Candidatus Daviesbacteria bacterium GW2011_GWA1_42_6]KKS70530.1 MAG: hypothetical protein UV41_C0020G0009 [Candidatus Daviesbacteria bacterium GW2011_GWA2_42_7]
MLLTFRCVSFGVVGIAEKAGAFTFQLSDKEGSIASNLANFVRHRVALPWAVKAVSNLFQDEYWEVVCRKGEVEQRDKAWKAKADKFPTFSEKILALHEALNKSYSQTTRCVLHFEDADDISTQIFLTQLLMARSKSGADLKDQADLITKELGAGWEALGMKKVVKAVLLGRLELTGQ